MARLRTVFGRPSWSFVNLAGRRRIGKTALIQHALREAGIERVLYVPIRDAGPAGALSPVADATETFGLAPAAFPRPTSFGDFARSVGALAKPGYVVAPYELQ